MAKVDVKCPFCGQADPVKKHGYAKSGHQRTDVSLVSVPSSSIMPIEPVSPE